ncbi:TPA: hypothetical protein ACGA3C_002209, partial [Enterococcus faecium]
SNLMNYFVGNKFILSYLHIYIIILYLVLKWDGVSHLTVRKYPMFMVYICWAVIISYVTDCSTGLVGCLLLVVFILYLRNLLTANIWLVVLLIADTVLLFFDAVILSQPAVQYFITKILGETLDLHGRLQMYDTIIPIFSTERIWGYGVNNHHIVLYSLVKAPNAQNGILNCLIQFGIAGTVVLLITLYMMLRKGKNINRSVPIMALIMMMSVISSVEITIDIYFILFCAIIWGISIQSETLQNKEVKDEKFPCKKCCF